VQKTRFAKLGGKGEERKKAGRISQRKKGGPTFYSMRGERAKKKEPFPLGEKEREKTGGTTIFSLSGRKKGERGSDNFIISGKGGAYPSTRTQERGSPPGRGRGKKKEEKEKRAVCWSAERKEREGYRSLPGGKGRGKGGCL